MELDQVVYEYGKLQLNFVACQRQNALLAQQLAGVNKQNAALTTDNGKASKRISRMEKFLASNRIAGGEDALSAFTTLNEQLDAEEKAAAEAAKANEKPDDPPATGIAAASQTAAGKLRAVPAPPRPANPAAEPPDGQNVPSPEKS